MNSRQRVSAALRHIQPDRPPRFIWLFSETAEKLAKKLGIPPSELEIVLGNDVL